MKIKTHHEEHWFDEVNVMVDDNTMICVETVERWKESELSGDEWRFSYKNILHTRSELSDKWEVQDNKTYGGSIEVAIRFATILLKDHLIKRIANSCPTISYKNRGVILFKSEFETPGRLILNLASDCINVSELSSFNYKLLDDVQKKRCSQPACPLPPSVVYKIKQEYDSCGHKQTFNFGDSYRHFCEKHKHRGNCSLEDSDSNYELVTSF